VKEFIVLWLVVVTIWLSTVAIYRLVVWWYEK
jgi:hypothetical protein